MTTNKRSEHGSVRHAMDRLQDLVGGLLGRAAAATVRSAETFVTNSAIGDMYEIHAAKLALERSASPQVKELAEEIIADHTTSKHHLEAALEMHETRGVKGPPKEMDDRRHKMLRSLEAAPREKFDRVYLDQQVSAHRETLELLTTYYEHGDNPQLRSCAAGAAPVVYRHLQRAESMKSLLAN